MTRHNLRHLRLLIRRQAQVREDRADRPRHLLTLSLSQTHPTLLHASPERRRAHGHEVLALAVVQLYQIDGPADSVVSTPGASPEPLSSTLVTPHTRLPACSSLSSCTFARSHCT